MKAQELRIGNLLSYDGTVVQVSNIGSNGFETTKDGVLYGSCNLESYDPIELTEQWLIDFGFEWKNDNNFWLNGFCLKTYDNKFYVLTEQKRVFIEFVHTLQNMYFCTEQKELKWSGLEKQNT